MLFNKISTLILLALTASAAPTKRQSGGGPEPWEIGVTIIPGQGAGDNPLGNYTPGGDCMLTILSLHYLGGRH